MNKKTIPKCYFCNVDLSKANRSNEHIYKKSWLLALGLDKYENHLLYQRGLSVVTERKVPAISVLGGAVCNSCNNGWMNDIDTRVEEIVLPLARGTELNLENVIKTESDQIALSRWILKTACAFEATDKSDRRHIPLRIKSALAKKDNPEYLPEGFVSFIVQIPPEQGFSGVTISSLDFWRGLGEGHPQFRRLKFAIQYNNIIFGCVYYLSSNIIPIFNFTPGYHQILLCNNALFNFREYSVDLLKFDISKFGSSDISICQTMIVFDGFAVPEEIIPDYRPNWARWCDRSYSAIFSSVKDDKAGIEPA